MSVGMVGFAGIGIESAGAGISGAYSATIVEFLPFVSESLIRERNDLPDPSIWANFDERKMYNGQQRVSGGLQTVAHPLLTGYLARLAFDVTTSGVGALLLNGVSSHAGLIAHRFITGQTQFQTGSGSDLPTATIEMNRGPIMGAGSSFVYYNMAANAFELVAEAGQFIRCNVELVGRRAGGKPRSTPSWVPAETFLWNTVSVAVNGVAKPFYESLTVRVENNLEAVPTLDGSLLPDLVKRNDFRRITVNGTLSFRNFDDYDGFLNGSETALQMTAVGKGVAGATGFEERLHIDVPRFRYSTFAPNIGGPGRIPINFTGRGMIVEPHSLYSLQVTLVNTRVSGYHLNTTA